MEWKIDYGDRRKRMAIMVSAYDHCLLELLWRWKSGELAVDITARALESRFPGGKGMHGIGDSISLPAG